MTGEAIIEQCPKCRTVNTVAVSCFKRDDKWCWSYRCHRCSHVFIVTEALRDGRRSGNRFFGRTPAVVHDGGRRDTVIVEEAKGWEESKRG